MASATPSRRRRVSNSAFDIPELPPYETPIAPLNPEQQRQIATLLSSRDLRDLKSHIKHAADLLTESAGQIGDRLIDAQVRYENQKEKANQSRRAGSDGEQAVNDADEALTEEQERLTGMEQKVDGLRGAMEERMRHLIDTESRIQGIEDAVGQMAREEAQAQTAQLAPRQTRTARRRPRRSDGDEEDMDEDDEQDENYESTPVREARELNAQNPPSRRLDDGLDREAEKWDSLSSTQKYAGHNHYAGFYRIVHESRFPNDRAPPVPHPSTWFADREDGSANSNRSQGLRSARNQREVSPAESDDIAIESERVSLICPITQRVFEDPVTSTKCPHSFEREPIMDMISRSSTTVPPPPGQGNRRIRSLKCPECDTVLTAGDLQTNAAMVLRVQRMLKAQREAEEEMDGDDSNPNRVTLASDAVDEDEDVDVDVDVDAPIIKAEPLTQQMPMETDSEGGESLDSEQDEEDEEDEE